MGAAPKRRATGRRRALPQPDARGVISTEDGGGFVRGTYSRGMSMYARRTTGEEAHLATFLPRMNSWQSTAAGREYYAHNRMQFIVNVPAICYKWSARRGGYVRMTIDGSVAGDSLHKMIPYDMDDITTAPDTDGDRAVAERLVLEQMRAYLNGIPRVLSVDGDELIRLCDEYPGVWVWDTTDEMTLDENVVRHIHSNGRIDFETLMDRPLRGVPLVYEKMYRRMGLCSIAMEAGEGTNDGGRLAYWTAR